MNWLSRIVIVPEGPEPLAKRIKRKALQDMGPEYEVLNWKRQLVLPLPGQTGPVYLVRLEKQEGPLKRVRIIDKPLPRVRLTVPERVRIKRG